MRRLPNPILTAALVSIAATAAVTFVPALRFAYRLPELHVALETSAAMVGLLAAYLVFGRFRRSGQLDDFTLCYSLSLLAFSNLLFAAIPAIAGSGTDRFGTWARLSGQLLGALIFAAASVAPRRRLRLSRTTRSPLRSRSPVVLATVAIVVALLGSRLPTGVELILTPEDSARPRLEGDVACSLRSSPGWASTASPRSASATGPERTGDELLQWLAVGALLRSVRAPELLPLPVAVHGLGLLGRLLPARVLRRHPRRAQHGRSAPTGRRSRIQRSSRNGGAWPATCTTASRRSSRSSAGTCAGSTRRDEAVARVTASASAGAQRVSPGHRRADEAARRAARGRARRGGARNRRSRGHAARPRPDAGHRARLPAPGRADQDRLRGDLERGAPRRSAHRARRARRPAAACASSGQRRRERVRPRRPCRRNGEGFGLISMRERAHAVGGSFDVDSRPGSGTMVEVVL